MTTGGFSFDDARAHMWEARLNLSRACDHLTAAYAHPWDDDAAALYTAKRSELIAEALALDVAIEELFTVVLALAVESRVTGAVEGFL